MTYQSQDIFWFLLRSAVDTLKKAPPLTRQEGGFFLALLRLAAEKVVDQGNQVGQIDLAILVEVSQAHRTGRHASPV